MVFASQGRVMKGKDSRKMATIIIMSLWYLNLLKHPLQLPQCKLHQKGSLAQMHLFSNSSQRLWPCSSSFFSWGWDFVVVETKRSFSQGASFRRFDTKQWRNINGPLRMIFQDGSFVEFLDNFRSLGGSSRKEMEEKSKQGLFLWVVSLQISWL